MSHRLISHSEISEALECEARHDFRYVGQLAGSALKSKATAPRLREGRAWGRAVATLHAEQLRTDHLALAHTALDAALEEDAVEQRDVGLYLPDDHAQMVVHLHELLDHYHATTDPLPIDRPEHEIVVPIPSRNTGRVSNRYRFQCFLDGVHVDGEGRTFIVEYKLRGDLTPLELLVLNRQYRWYAWAWRAVTGIEPAGVIVDERWNRVPLPARLVNGRGKDAPKVASHAKDQVTTPQLYLAACAATGEEPNPDTVDHLGRRRWQQRERVMFRAGELDEAGLQMVSAAKLIRDLDTGERFPIRNPSRVRCPGCPFREICPTPSDEDLVDALYERVAAKRDREREAVPA